MTATNMCSNFMVSGVVPPWVRASGVNYVGFLDALEFLPVYSDKICYRPNFLYHL